MRKTSMFHRAQGLLVLLLVSQTAAMAAPPQGFGGRTMQSGGHVSNSGGMKTMSKVFTPPMGTSGGSRVFQTTPGKLSGGNPQFGHSQFGNGTPHVFKGQVTGGSKIGFPKGTVFNPGNGHGTNGKSPIKNGPFVPVGGISGKLPTSGPFVPSGGVIGKGPKFPGGIGPIVFGGTPKIPIDPGIGNGQGKPPGSGGGHGPGQGPGNGTGHGKWHNHGWWNSGWGGWGGIGYGGNCGPFPPWWYQPSWYPKWHGCYGHFHCPVIQPCPLPVYYQTVYTVPVVTASTVAVQSGVTDVDLMVMGVKVLEPGTPNKGTLFRVQVANKGPSDLAAATRLAIFAARDTKSEGELPRTIVPMPGLAAGKTVELDVRFPREAFGDPLLIVAVEVPQGYRDVNEQDNIAQGEIASLSGMEPAAQ